MSSNASLTLIIIGQLVMMALSAVFGKFSDRVGRKLMWWASLVGLFVMAIPMYGLMAQGYFQARHRLRRAGAALRGPAQHDLGDVPRHVPDACPLRGLRHRLQSVDRLVWRHGTGGQPSG